MKNIKITAALLREFNPCYDPTEVMPEDEEITLKEAIIKYRNSVREKEHVIWVLCRNKFMSNKEMRLFAVWCAREALKLMESPDPRSIAACDVAERYANDEATDEELVAASAAAGAAVVNAAGKPAWSARAAWDAAMGASWSTAWDAATAARDSSRDAARAARDAARDSSRDAAWSAWDVSVNAQIDKLLTYFD